jgi:predicted nucleotidyltransferase
MDESDTSCQAIKLNGAESIMNDNIRRELVDGIINTLGNMVISIILYGSVARGTDLESSDVDIAVLLNGELNPTLEDQLSDFIVDMNLEYDKVFSVIDISIDRFKEWEKILPFYQNVSREGIVLWKAA